MGKGKRNMRAVSRAEADGASSDGDGERMA
jgi:hypothetical protein